MNLGVPLFSETPIWIHCVFWRFETTQALLSGSKPGAREGNEKNFIESVPNSSVKDVNFSPSLRVFYWHPDWSGKTQIIKQIQRETRSEAQPQRVFLRGLSLAQISNCLGHPEMFSAANIRKFPRRIVLFFKPKGHSVLG